VWALVKAFFMQCLHYLRSSSLFFKSLFAYTGPCFGLVWITKAFNLEWLLNL